jgi:hypothetical protein
VDVARGRHIADEPFEIELDVTDALRSLDRSAEETPLKLVAVGVDGKPLGPDDVDFEEIELVVD